VSNQDSSAFDFLQKEMQRNKQRIDRSFEEYTELIKENPRRVLRSISQLFYDMVKANVREEEDMNSEDRESIGFVRYDCSKLFVDGADKPFFADTPFANRFMLQIGTLRQGIQQNRIHVYDGPTGSGKSTFLNNLLRMFEVYTSTPEGYAFEVLWDIDEAVIKDPAKENKDLQLSVRNVDEVPDSASSQKQRSGGSLRISCPSHDYPILVIPKEYRFRFFYHLLPTRTKKEREIRDYILREKEYEWLFGGEACIVCKSIFQSLFDRLGSLEKVLQMMRVRVVRFDRRVGEGITVFNPGDPTYLQSSQPAMHLPKDHNTDHSLQERLDRLFGENAVRYSYSPLAKTNNGIYVLMDIKLHNKDRLLELHNVLSEGIHKVGDVEENINSLFFALMNPEDKKVIEDAKMESFQGRIQFNTITYVLEPKTEIDIYCNVFGQSIEKHFLPRVLDNFARAVVGSRMNQECVPQKEWIPDFKKYSRYCDGFGLLLRMELYSNNIPVWLSEEDKNKFKAEVRRAVIGEGLKEGMKGFSGRESIALFSDFFGRYSNDEKLITMNDVVEFFKHGMPKLIRDQKLPPKGFLDSLVASYDYAVLNEMKEALYFYGKDQISRDILNFLEATNYDFGDTFECRYTHEEVQVTVDFLRLMANRLAGRGANVIEAQKFARDIQKKYVVVVASQGTEIIKTDLYRELFDAYVRRLKENALQPFMDNKNFREAIKAFGTEDFDSHDARIREHVSHMIENLMKNFGHNEQSAKEVSLYVLDKNLVSKFAEAAQTTQPKVPFGRIFP